jgi:glycosyltransferase involved in cell wall biosynthesis
MYGGVERVLETAARSKELCKGLDLRFAICFEGRLAELLRSSDVSVEMLGRVRVTRPDLVMRARARLSAVIRRDHPDVVLTQSAWSHALFAPVARRLSVPLAFWVHDELHGGSWLERLAARSSPDLLICNSRYTERAARAVFPRAPSQVIRYPLLREAVLETRQDVRSRNATSDDAVVIVNVARMEPYKGQHVLIDALSRMKAAAPWMCWVVGGAQRTSEKRYEQSLRAHVAVSGLQDRILFLGMRHDVRSLLSASDVHCHPNQEGEPFGLALVEALHAGLPVIATRLGGPAEIVTDSCGRLVPAADPDALADALSTLVDDADIRRRLGEAGPDRALELCDPGPRLADLKAALEHVRLRAAA